MSAKNLNRERIHTHFQTLQQTLHSLNDTSSAVSFSAKLHIELLVLLLVEEPEISWMLIGVSDATVTCWFLKNGPSLTFCEVWALCISDHSHLKVWK